MVDLVLSTLPGPLKGTALIKINYQDSKINEEVSLLGFDKTSHRDVQTFHVDGTSVPINYPRLSVAVLDVHVISELWVYQLALLSGEDIASACPGDSGGPIVSRTRYGYLLNGITVLTYGCASNPLTNVTYGLN